MQISNYQIIWMHSSHHERAIEMNRDAGFTHQNMAWFKKIHKQESVFSMACFSHAGELIGWSMYRKNSSGIEILWMIVPDDIKNHGVGTAMIDRLKGWLQSVKDRRGALMCSVHQYADDMLYFLRERGFICLKIDSRSQTYRMCFIGESKKDDIE